MNQSDYVTQLANAGLIDAELLTQDQKDEFNQNLTQDDVDTLISIKEKLGGVSLDRNAFFFPL